MLLGLLVGAPLCVALRLLVPERVLVRGGERSAEDEPGGLEEALMVARAEALAVAVLLSASVALRVDVGLKEEVAAALSDRKPVALMLAEEALRLPVEEEEGVSVCELLAEALDVPDTVRLDVPVAEALEEPVAEALEVPRATLLQVPVAEEEGAPVWLRVVCAMLGAAVSEELPITAPLGDDAEDSIDELLAALLALSLLAAKEEGVAELLGDAVSVELTAPV